MDVLGENEALQQFFEGQDVTGVLDSAVVDTSILEQYLSNMDPTFMLPESPPDSGSEPCSPPQIPDVNWSSQQMNQESLAHMEIPPPASCRRTHEHFSDPVRTQHSGLGTPAVKAGTSAAALQARNPPPDPRYLSPGGNYVQQTSTLPLLHVHSPLQNSQSLVPGGTMQYAGTSMSPASSCLQPHSSGHPDPVYNYVPTRLGTGQQTREVLQDGNKRRRSDSFEGADDQCHWRDPAWKKPLFSSESGACDVPSNDTEGPNGGSCQGPYQLLTWDRYQFGQWNTLYNSNYESLPPPAYHVDTDKGFNYSSADEAFVCQKKNHFQVTIHVGMVGEPKYVKIQTGLVPIDSFCVKVFGIKLEAQNHFITIEQSQADRSKRPFLPVKVNLPGDKITKVTLGRLHFSETTANNMRKKGKPNPDQRYFMMVVGLYATVKDESHLVVAYVSERIIVRTSNPGQFENESEVLWQRGQAPESVVCHGRVGINTDTPDEALVVCGNARIMGTVMHPSDKRAKQNIFEVDSTEQLKRISQMRIVEYDYKPEFAAKMGIDHVHETGVIAQEVKELLPTAVREVGDVTCSDGGRIPNFLMVDKEQIFMENVGAVKQLCKLTDNLEERIQELEVWNTRLAKLKNLGSLRSKSGPTSKGGTIPNKTPPPPKKPTPPQSSKESMWEKYNHCLQHRVFQASIIMLVTTMAFCIISITALYLLTLEENLDFDMSTNTSTLPPDIPSTTKPPAPWPPDLDFSGLFYSEDIQCCPSSSSSSSSSTSSARNDTLVAPTTADLTPSPNLFTNSGGLLDHAQKKLIANFKKTSDWTNTTINSILITQNQQRIDKRYCQRHNCRPGDYTYDIPVSKFVPVNMPVTLLMNTSELLVIHLCGYEERAECSALMDYSSADIYTPLNTQGYIHMWPVPVARYYRSSYHFRATVAGQADCDTHQSYRQVLFTDYRFHFHRRCD